MPWQRLVFALSHVLTSHLLEKELLCVVVGLYGDAVPAGRWLPAFAFMLKVVSEVLWPQVHAAISQPFQGSPSPELLHLWGKKKPTLGALGWQIAFQAAWSLVVCQKGAI